MNLITKLWNIQEETQNKITLWMNHLLVVYAFLIPISHRGTEKIFIILLFLFLIRRNYIFYLKEAFSNKIVQAIIIFILINIVWLIETDDFIEAQKTISGLKYYLYLIVFLAFLDKNFSFRVMYAFVLGMLFSEFISYLIHFSILPAKLEISNTLIYKTKNYDPTPFLHHSMYNVLISIAIGITLLNLLTNKNKWFIKLISIFFIITASINLTLVGGRIGYITYIVSILTVLILIYKKKIIKIFIPVLCMISIFYFLAYNYSSTFKQRIDYSIKNAQSLLSDKPNFKSSEGYRIGAWIYSFEVIKDNFIFGTGTGDGMLELRNQTPPNLKYIGKYLLHIHNEYIKVFLEFGIIGFIAFLNIFYQIFRYNIEDDNLKRILTISTIAIGLSLMTDVLTKVVLIFWILTIAATTTRNTYLVKENKLTNKKILAYILVVLFVLAYSFRLI